MVANIIKGGGKVKKKVREKKERRGLASSHEHTRSYSSRETICTTNFASGSFHFYYFNTNKPNYHQQLTKYKYTRTHQEWRANVPWTLFNFNQPWSWWSWWRWVNGDLQNHQLLDWKSQFTCTRKISIFLKKTTKEDKWECFSFTLNSLVAEIDWERKKLNIKWKFFCDS